MKISEMSFEELLITRVEIQFKLRHCKNQKVYRDTNKYYQKLCQEIGRRRKM